MIYHIEFDLDLRPMIIQVVVVIIAYAVISIYKEIKQRRKDKELDDMLFEWEGGQYNKSFYEIIDGKLAEKK